MRTKTRPAPWSAVAALGAIGAVTVVWWALALWPVGPLAPDWILRTRLVCFGAARTGLPDAGGWLLLIGQPAGMLLVLIAVWPAELKTGLAGLMTRVSGQIGAGVVGALLTAGLVGVAARVARAGGEPFSTGTGAGLAGQLTRVDDAAPAMALVDETGRTVSLEMYRGRPVLVTFAYAHCDTVCPVLVSDVLAAAGRATGAPPAVLIVTLDPWRDTPSRLAAIRSAWRLTGDAHVLSGAPDVVDRVLNAWRIPRARNERTGDLSHPSLVYVIGVDGRVTYVVTGGADVIDAALRAL
jgi:protein SCO1/2